MPLDKEQRRELGELTLDRELESFWADHQVLEELEPTKAVLFAMLTELKQRRAVDILDWRIVEQASAQYPGGRWEADLELPVGKSVWRLVPADLHP